MTNINKLQEALIDLFLYANKVMLKTNGSHILSVTNTTCICACLKSAFDTILPYSIFEKYYADVAYSGCNGGYIQLSLNGEQIYKLAGDLILHSRNKLSNDNLICLEMQKNPMDQDILADTRNKLKCLTKNYDCGIFDNKRVIGNYSLGILYIIDPKSSALTIEFYSDGVLLREQSLSFKDAFELNVSLTFLKRRSIVFFNMNFGDSFLINDRNYSLLVDCGSMCQTKVRRGYMLNLICGRMKDLNNNLLITHYHNDHTSLLRDIPSKGITFNNIYVRCLDAKCFKFDFYSSLFELIIYAKKSHDYNPLLQWFDPKRLLSLLGNAGHVHGINADTNNVVRFGGTSANILWPSAKQIDIPGLDDIANRLESLVLGLSGDEISQEETSSIRQHIKAMYLCYQSIYNNLLQSDHIISKDNIIEQLSGIESFEADIYREIIQEFVASISITKELRKKLSNLENHLSIVFEIDSKLLMCGDADNNAMDNALLNYANKHGLSMITADKFEIIKVPHHGTSDYYYDFRNNKASFLIPNTELFRSSWKIDVRYVGGMNCCFSLNNGYKSACPNAGCNCRCASSDGALLLGSADYYGINF